MTNLLLELYGREGREEETVQQASDGSGSFTPLIFKTTGVMSHECTVFHKSLAEKISTKRGDRYDEVMRY